MDKQLPIVFAISAASGSIIGLRALSFLLENDYKVELIISQNAYPILKDELGLEIAHDCQLIKDNLLNFLGCENKKNFLKVWLNDELWASAASGSYKTSLMIISPASMATVAGISSGLANSLILRAADVCIKESRKLVLVPRETPFSSIHLENLVKLSRLGVKIVPPIPGFYAKIKTLDDCIDFIVGKVFDVCDIPNNLYERWK